MKKIVLSHTYILDSDSQRHELTATSAGDLADQVQKLTGRKQAGNLARSAWGDEAADIRASGLRLVATGAVVREIWRTLPSLKGNEKAEKAEAKAVQLQAEQLTTSSDPSADEAQPEHEPTNLESETTPDRWP